MKYLRLLCISVLVLGCSKQKSFYPKSITYQYQAWDSQYLFYTTYPTTIINQNEHYPSSRTFVVTLDTITKIAILNNDTFNQSGSRYIKIGRMGIPLDDAHFLSFKGDTMILQHVALRNTTKQEAIISAYRISSL
ncbi:MAG: hypothetical protein JSS78_08505 [Bacteroidetes bacterium]|nr:hypothetical protein [Bacteroidota bacterium]